MSRLTLLVLPLLATPVQAHDGLHHHPHGIEFGWLSAALVGSIIGGGMVYAFRRRK
jgi:hypothetical protein